MEIHKKIGTESLLDRKDVRSGLELPK